MVKFKGVPIQNPRSPRDLQKGGYIYTSKPSTRLQKMSDSVLAVLQPGELVVPKRHTKKVKLFLRKRKIRLPS